MADPVQIAASTIGGSCIATILARAFIARNLKDLEDAVKKIADIKSELAGIAVRLESFNKTHEILREIEKKVIALEAKFYDRNRSARHAGDP